MLALKTNLLALTKQKIPVNCQIEHLRRLSDFVITNFGQNNAFYAFVHATFT